MKIENLILVGMVYKKLEPIKYEIKEKGETKEVFSYQILLDLGEEVVTLKVRKEIYEQLEKHNKYAFQFKIDTEQEKEKDRYKVLELLPFEPIDEEDDYILISNSEYEKLAPKGATQKPKAGPNKQAKTAQN